MKVLMLSDPASSHTIRWANALNEKGIDIFLFGLNKYDRTLYSDRIKINTLDIPINIKQKTDGAISKIVYLKAIQNVRRIIRSYKPDLIHAQYATSYGFIASIVNFHPLLIQVWGADIFNFPKKSFLHRKIVEYNLSRADRILSTSRIMLQETLKYTNKQVDFFYLGVDTNKFKPKKSPTLFYPEDLVIGTIKTLEKKYGIEYLIRAFKIVKDKFQGISLKLLIVGSGSQEYELKELTRELKVESSTIFTGYIKQSEIVDYYNMLDIYVALSIEESESFGLAVIEASACEKPVIVSDIGGLPEAVDDNLTGIIVRNKNIEEAAHALQKLILDRMLRLELGRNGRMRVLDKFNWDDKVSEMIKLYQKMLKNRNDYA